MAEPAALGPASDAPSKPGFFARLLAIFIPVAICLGGVAFAGLMVATRPAAERTEPEERGVPVSTAELQPTRETVVIRANGQVIPARQVVPSLCYAGDDLLITPERDASIVLNGKNTYRGLLRITRNGQKLSLPISKWG